MTSTHIKNKIYNSFCKAKDKKRVTISKIQNIQEFKPNKKKQRKVLQTILSRKQK